ncbi:MAG: aryl-sulfate sulfotransferase [Myxococcota bacterium]
MTWWLWLVGCAGDGEGPQRPPPAPTSGETGVPPLIPGCQLDPRNVIRLQCLTERDAVGPLEVRVTGGDWDEPVVFPGDPGAASQVVAVWDLLERTPYRWELVDRGEVVDAGEVETDALEPSLSPMLTPLIDAPSSAARTVFALTCSGGSALYAVDTLGRTRWYQDLSSRSYVSGFDVTDRGSVLAILGRVELGEWSFGGAETRWPYPTAIPELVHHSVLGQGGETLILDAEARQYPDGDYVVDGVTELADGEARHRWDVAEVVDPVGLTGGDALYWASYFPGAIDFGHANSLVRTADGGLLLSFKHLGVILKLDPDDQVEWWLPGRAPEVWFDAPLLSLGSSVGLDAAFEAQHHVTELPSGDLLVYDNGEDGALSRVIQLHPDLSALTADVVREWPIGLVCPVQSSAFLLDDGALLVACATAHQLLELDQAGVRRQVSVGCGDGGIGTSFVRAEPVVSLAPLTAAR